MSVIFLDIDGVLLNRESYKGKRLSEQRPVPSVLAAFNRIITETKADIVVSSLWRIGRTRIELAELFSEWGVSGRVLDRTGDMLPTRGAEIGKWLTEYPRDIESFVIIDDDKDMDGLSHRLVKTNFEDGLTEADADKAIALLRVQSKVTL